MPTSLPPSPFHLPNVMQPPSNVSTKPVLNVAAKFSVNRITYRNAGAQFSFLRGPVCLQRDPEPDSIWSPRIHPVELTSLRKGQRRGLSG